MLQQHASSLKNNIKRLYLQSLHIDPLLFTLLLLLAATGLFILYSASNSNLPMLEKQGIRMAIAFGVLFIFAQIPPHIYRHWAPWFFGITIIMLISALLFGQTSQGAKRWLNLAAFRFQPSELMKLTTPMILAFYMNNKPMPPNIKILSIATIILAVPVLLTAKQPDLGTAILIATSGIFIILLAGISWKIIISIVSAGLLSTPLLWHFMHHYQRERVLTLLNPERDPLGSGYHIIQSKIAIGSGGVLGKGYLAGTQSHLQFLPAHATDFIFAVSSEEFGLFGSLIIILLFLAILCRCLVISIKAQNNFTRLLSGSLCLSIFLSAFINMGMVVGILPVVGVPLPLISYGGSSILTMMASFGIIMSIQTHRKLWSS